MLSLEGALAGLLCGMGIYAAGCFALHTVPVWPWGKLVGVLLLTLTLGTVCGLYPAYQAAGLRRWMPCAGRNKKGLLFFARVV